MSQRFIQLPTPNGKIITLRVDQITSIMETDIGEGSWIHTPHSRFECSLPVDDLLEDLEHCGCCIHHYYGDPE